MTSKVGLCNIALSRLKAGTITALTDNTQAAILCNAMFDDLADEVAVDGMWSSTIKRASLAQTTNTPVYEYDNEYQLPVDPFCLSVINVNEDKIGSYNYVIEGDKLLTDESSIKIKYIARITDVQKWDPFYKRTFIARLTAELAVPLTGNQALADRLYEKYLQIRRESLAQDGKQGSKQVARTNDLIDVRR